MSGAVMNDSTKLLLRPSGPRTSKSASSGTLNVGAPPTKIAARANGATSAQKVEKPKILLLDDEERILNALSALFRDSRPGSAY